MTVNALWLAQFRLKRGHYDACVELCDQLLEKNGLDMAAWFVKCRALTLKAWIDDLESEEEIAEDAFSERRLTTQQMETPFRRPFTTWKDSRLRKPSTRSGRSSAGFVRPGTAQRPPTSRRPGTASVRPSTANVVRMATAHQRDALLKDPFLRISESNVQACVKNRPCTKALCDFYLYYEQNLQKALDLCLAIQQEGEMDAWWEARFGKCYDRLGMITQAEHYFWSSLDKQRLPPTAIELGKILLRQNRTHNALEIYAFILEAFPGDVDGLAAKARVLDDSESASMCYKEILKMDASNIEALACLAAHHFDSDAPHIALRYYRRLLQMGTNSVELWNNLGLCCLRMGQYEISLHCFCEALKMANDDNAADVWYNIGKEQNNVFILAFAKGHVGIGLGDCEMAEQAFSVAVAFDPFHSEALNNLGVLLKEAGNETSAEYHFERSRSVNANISPFEPWYNGSVIAMEKGNIEKAFECVMQALSIAPENASCQKIFQILSRKLSLY